MKKLINIITVALVAALFTQSCHSDDSVVASYLNIFRGDDSTAISQLDFNIGSAFTMLGIDCDANWSATSDADWCTLSNHVGYGYTNKRSYVKLSVAKNDGDARTATVTFSSGGTVKTLTITQKGSGADVGDTFQTAFEFVESLTFGYNLYNTLEANPDINESWWNPTSVSDWETGWGQPITTQEEIDSIVAGGVNIIRVPVTWYPHMDADDNVSTEWMDRVEEVVKYVLNTGSYCIINVHHDASARGTRTDGIAWLRADMDEYETTSVRFKKLWTQIANRFKDYDEHLLFEAFNEILDNTDNWGDPTDATAYTAVTKLEQDFVDAVRATGGNNEYRNLVVNPYSAGNSQAKLDGFQAPNDVHSNHILATVHTYDPYGFCNSNKDGNNDWNIYIWDSSCEAEIDALTARVNNRFNDLGLPYIYGEFGALDPDKELGERIKYARYIMGKFVNYETTGIWWDADNSSKSWDGLFNRKTNEWNETEIQSIFVSATQK